MAEQTKKIAADVFKRHPEKDKAFVTSDGQAFTDEAHAQNHAVKNRTGKELKMQRFLREEFEKEGEKTNGKQEQS